MCAILCPCQDLYKSWKNPSRKRQKTNRGKRRPVWWADNKNKWDPEDPEDDDEGGWEPKAPLYKGHWQDRGDSSSGGRWAWAWVN